MEKTVTTAGQLNSESLREAFFKWADVAISQSNDLWTLCLPFFGICVLIMMHLLGKGGAPKMLLFFLFCSAFATGFSLFTGYKLKGSVVKALKDSVSSASVAIPDTPGQDALVQFLAFGSGLILFLIAFGFYSRTVATALIDTIKGR